MHIGFDIGGTTARFIAINSANEVVANTTMKSRNWTPTDACRFVKKQVDSLTTSESEPIVEPIGIALAAQLSRDGSHVLNAPNLSWKNEAFQALVENEVGKKVMLINDLNAAVFAEFTTGAAVGFREVLGVYVGSGVGGAIIQRGHLVRGAGNVAGEIGHVKTDPSASARLCGCGQRGCVEAYAGGVHLEQMLQDLLPVLAKARVVDLAKADTMLEENPTIKKVWQTGTDALSTAIANACTLLNPGVLILGGGVLNHATNFREMLVEKLGPRMSVTARATLEIRYAELGDRGGALGAALLAKSKQ